MEIEANLKKFEVILKMKSPKDLKDNQSLVENIVRLSEFISKIEQMLSILN